MQLNPLTLIDFYKADHRSQYPAGTETVFSNLTPRKSRIEGSDKLVFFGLQYWVDEYLGRVWDAGFFNLPKEEVVDSYRRRMVNAGISISYDHIEALHDLGYLPLEIWALPEGSSVPMGVPPLVMWNTHPDFFWLTNYLETSISCAVWGPSTSATTAARYKRLFDAAAVQTGGAPEFTMFQGHDFSARGMWGHEAAAMSGAGHLTSFAGTDTVWAIDFVERYYGADSGIELVGGSVPATEHSVMSMGERGGERETYRRLITETYPEGIVSIVSDTYDYWNVLTNILPSLRDEIMARPGDMSKVVVRPDSGDPVKILCGDPEAAPGTPEHKGTFEVLWENFGGSTTAEGFKMLDSHVGVIYGDAITFERAEAIVSGLIGKDFVPSMVFGIGSFTYSYVTRDTYGMAMKATAGVVDGKLREIYKDPATDDGTKKSARGLVAVYEENGSFRLADRASWYDVVNCAFEQVYLDGTQVRCETLAEIRARVANV